MKVCPQCGKESRDIDRFCLHCGLRLEREDDAEAMPIYVSSPQARNGASRSQSGSAEPRGGQSRSGSGKNAGSGARGPESANSSAADDGGPVARLVLQAREDEKEGAREFPLDGHEVIIGRAPSCDVVLPDDQLASRRHTLLRFDEEQGQYTAVDLGSSNGTYVNGVEIRDVVVLADGDHLSVGEHELIYSKLSGVAQPAVERQPTAPPATSASSATHTAMGVPTNPRSGASAIDHFPIPVPPAWPPRFSDAPAAADRPTQAPAASAEPATADVAPADVAGAADAAADTDTARLHRQLVEAGAALARRAQEAERDALRLRSTLAGLSQQVNEALAALHPNPPAASPESSPEGTPNLMAAPGASLDELIAVARQAAETPYLNAVSALAARAAEIARALEAQRALVTAVEAIHDRLATLAAPPRQLPLALDPHEAEAEREPEAEHKAEAEPEPEPQAES